MACRTGCRSSRSAPACATVGTELGLIDYSLALELGTEVNLAPGLFWQGVLSAPVLQSDDQTGQPLAGYRARDLGFDSSLLSYWQALPNGASAQASAGYVDRKLPRRHGRGPVDDRGRSAGA